MQFNFRSVVLLTGLLAAAFSTTGQGNQRVDSIYNAAVSLYQQKELNNAKSEFEKVVLLNPGHKDALFNLGAIHYEQGNKEQAFQLFQKCVQLKDRQAAALLKQLGQTIAYSDTMDIEDIDSPPKVIVGSMTEAVYTNGVLNRAIEKQIVQGFKKSPVLRKELGTGRKVFVNMSFGKDGKMDASVIGKDKTRN